MKTSRHPGRRPPSPADTGVHPGETLAEVLKAALLGSALEHHPAERSADPARQRAEESFGELARDIEQFIRAGDSFWFATARAAFDRGLLDHHPAAEARPAGVTH